MTHLAVPFHLDERLPDFPLPVPVRTIDPSLPDTSARDRMGTLYDTVAEVVRHDAHPVVFSGDSTTSLGVVTGLQRREASPAVVWVDAHGDLNTPQTSLTGYLGGMPLAMLLGHGERSVPNRLGLAPVLPEQVLLVDGRDLDPGERDLIATAPLRHVPVSEVSTWLVPDGPIYLHVDLDVFDPQEVPGLMFPAPGGPTPGAVAEAVRTVLSTGRVAAVGLACTLSADHLGDPRVQGVLDMLVGLVES